MQFRTAFGTALHVESAIAAAVFAVVAGTVGVAFMLSRRRRRRGLGPSRKSEANRVELTTFGSLAIIAALLATFSLTLNNRERQLQPRPALTVDVLGYQWCWKFTYPGHNVSVTGTCNGRDNPILVLPTGRPIRVNVTSNDVIHGFWVTHLRWKIYAYPGHTNSFTVTLNHAGTWPGRCSEFCGLYHYRMDFSLRAVSPAQFTSWLGSHSGHLAAAGSR